MSHPILVAGVLLAVTLGTTATAQSTLSETTPSETQPPLSEIIRGFEERGYQVTDVDVDTSAIEIEARDPNGTRIEARVDPANGEVLDESPED